MLNALSPEKHPMPGAKVGVIGSGQGMTEVRARVTRLRPSATWSLCEVHAHICRDATLVQAHAYAHESSFDGRTTCLLLCPRSRLEHRHVILHCSSCCCGTSPSTVPAELCPSSCWKVRCQGVVRSTLCTGLLANTSKPVADQGACAFCSFRRGDATTMRGATNDSGWNLNLPNLFRGIWNTHNCWSCCNESRL